MTGPRAAADRRRRSVLDLAHKAFPGDDRLVVGLAQLVERGDAERRHEVLHVEPVGTPVRALFCFEARFLLRGSPPADRSARPPTASEMGKELAPRSWRRIFGSDAGPLIYRGRRSPRVGTGELLALTRERQKVLSGPRGCRIRRQLAPARRPTAILLSRSALIHAATAPFTLTGTARECTAPRRVRIRSSGTQAVVGVLN